MKEITLSNSPLKALVDDDDFDLVSGNTWFVTPSGAAYAWVKSIRRNEFMHRIIMGRPAGVDVDHWDHNRLNNQRWNLRLASRAQNRMNGKKHRNTSSAYKGVSWHKASEKWTAQICLGKLKYLGLFEKEIDAARAYNEEARKLFGDFAFLNPV